MDPNASVERDDERNSVVRSPLPRPPFPTSAVLPAAAAVPPPPCDRGFDQVDSERRVSRLRTRDADDDDVNLPSVLSQSGERSVLIPRRGEGVTPYHIAYQHPNGEQDIEGRRTRPSQGDKLPMTKGERGRRPSPQDKKAEFRLELVSSREPAEDIVVSREVSGSNPLFMQAVAREGGDQRSMSPFIDKPTTHHFELAPAREQGPEDLVGRRHAVLPAATVEDQVQDGTNQHDTFLQVHSQQFAVTALVEGDQQEFLVDGGEQVAQPGAYHVDGIYSRHDATIGDTIFGVVDISGSNDDVALREDHDDEELLSAQLVDPEADRLQLQREVQTLVRREVQLLAQHDSSEKACCIVAGVNFSKRTNQAICLLVLTLAVAALIAPMLATDIVGL